MSVVSSLDFKLGLIGRGWEGEALVVPLPPSDRCVSDRAGEGEWVSVDHCLVLC